MPCHAMPCHAMPCHASALAIYSLERSSCPFWQDVNTAGTSPSPKIEALKQRLKSIAVNATVLQLDRSEFEDTAMAYTFSLTVTNFLGMSATNNFTVRIVNDVLPVVSIAGPPQVSASVEDRLAFEALVKLPACARQDSHLEFQWLIFDGSTPTVPRCSLALNKRELTLPPRALAPGKQYTVQVTSCIGRCSSRQPNSVSKVSLIVVHIAPRAILAGGRIRTAAQDATIVLDGSRSFDPESAALGQQVLVYKWDCKDDAASAGRNESTPSCSSLVSSINNPKLSIQAAALRASSQYVFSLTVERAGCDLAGSLGCRSEKAFVTVNVVKTPTLNVQVYVSTCRGNDV